MRRVFFARPAIRAALAAIILVAFSAPAQAAVKTCSKPLTRNIPERTARAPSGSAVMQEVLNLSGSQRDAVVAQQVLAGNLPSYLRDLTPVKIAGTLAGGRAVLITLCVTPGYLAVGSDRDFVRVPMGLAAAARIANQFGFLLPTTKMVDAIYAQAKVHLAPSPMKPTNQMSSTPYLMQHSQTVDKQRARLSRSMTDLTAGQKKDIVLSTRLRSKPGRVAIYGWHRTNGKPIQPLSTVHGAQYADYSHGVRLVSQTAYVNGEPVTLTALMRDRELSEILSSEGPIDNVAAFQASLFR